MTNWNKNRKRPYGKNLSPSRIKSILNDFLMMLVENQNETNRMLGEDHPDYEEVFYPDKIDDLPYHLESIQASFADQGLTLTQESVLFHLKRHYPQLRED
tara:strand:- start:1703 stop:2002 length:300 start_codon:yes stop_codon:yes gene_type:complete